MTQRVFDVENEQDMQDLWSILPDNAWEVCRTKNPKAPYVRLQNNTGHYIFDDLIAINWGHKERIEKPIKEVTEADIGKLCMFWDNRDGIVHYGILQSIGSSYYCLSNSFPYSETYKHCRRLTKQEIEELC